MTSGEMPPGAGTRTADLEVRRLILDLEDLRFENARLKTSIAERQDEIAALSGRLAQLQAQQKRRHGVVGLKTLVRHLQALRVFLRR